jgi:hypothetical protein
MATTSAARPAKTPARAGFAIGVRKTAVKKTVAAKKTVAKKPAAKRPAVKKAVKKTPVKKVAAKKPVRRASSRLSPAQRAGVGARLRTIATTTVGAEKSKIAAAENADGNARASVKPRASRKAVAKPKSAPRPRRRSAVDRIGDLPPGAPLSDRVVSAIEHELTQIENIIGRSRVQPDERTEGERRARTLASLARTLSELKKLRTDEEATRPADDDAASRDIDAVRLDLARRLDVLVASAKAVHPEPAAGEGPS